MAQQGDSRRIIFTQDARFAVAKSDGKPVTLTGYALVWSVLSTDRGGYKVRLLPNSATFAKPTHALFHHNFRDVIGTTENGSLRLTPDDYGVKAEIDLPDTTVGRDVAALVAGKYVTGMSFAMVSSPRGRTTKENGQEIFEAESYAVDEVTITPIPAFQETSIAVKPPPSQHAARTEHALRLAKMKLDLYRPGSVARTAV